MPRGNGEVVGSDNWHMSTAVADDSSAETRVQIQGYNQVSKPLPGLESTAGRSFRVWDGARPA
jgi:hypothetical protein